mmetsp:Transcript_63806/g.138741  ORF Transcript_63806/g.138741 Transcript_63806/m.138741 type:complete len:255 (-) Transcript_63806:166-930(-)
MTISKEPLPVAPIVCSLIALSGTMLAFYWQRKRRSFVRDELPDISIPEALYAMLHGPKEHRAQAARALSEVLSGEVQALEEVLDEAAGVHPQYGGGKRGDGHCLLSLALESLNQEDDIAEAMIDFLLQITAYDIEWDDQDEWNQTALRAIGVLWDLGAVKFLERGGGNAHIKGKTTILLRRLKGERLPTPEPREYDLDEKPCMLSMNTRVYCPQCLTMQLDMVRCPQCKNVGYCCKEHMLEDRERHSFWCFPRS